MTSKPKVADVSWDCWEVNGDESVTVYKAQHLEFYQILLKGKRPKYFYGESSAVDSQRWIQDNHTHDTECRSTGSRSLGLTITNC